MFKSLLFSTLLITNLFSSNFLNSYDDGLKLANKENKILLVILSVDGCGACEYLKDRTLVDPTTLKLLNKDFVVVELNTENDKIPKHLSFYATPTLFFLDKDGELIDTIIGALNVADFNRFIKNVKEDVLDFN